MVPNRRRLDTADALPFDILPLFFHYLTHNGDMANVALVCSAWHQAVLARLYSVVGYSLANARTNGRVLSPFDVILKHPEYALHVRHIIVKSVPTTANAAKPDMRFIAAVSKCIQLCDNLASFTCTAHALLPFVLGDLTAHKPRLTDIKLEATMLNYAEAAELSKMKRLRHIALDAPSRPVLHFLSKLVANNKEKLTSLSITNSIDLTPDLLNTSLSEVPELKSLAITNCLSVTHKELLRVIHRPHHHLPPPAPNPFAFTPSGSITPSPSLASSLESLSLTIYTSTPSPDALWPTLLSLKHLTIYVRQCGRTDLHPTVRSVLQCASQAALESLTLRDVDRVEMDGTVLDAIIKDHKMTLRRFNLVSFMVTDAQVRKICAELRELEQLSFFITTYPEVLATALGKAKKLTTLIDSQSATGHAGRDASLDSSSVKKLFQRCAGSLRTVKITGRTYTAEWNEAEKTKGGSKKQLKMTLHRNRHPFIII